MKVNKRKDLNKVFVKNAKPTQWYHSFIGKSIAVSDELIEQNGQLHFSPLGFEYYLIKKTDCLTKEEFRELKLKRIINYERRR